MIQTISLRPGITLRCFPDRRFKHGCLSIQFIRPMHRDEAALNVLVPAILLRGTVSAPDLRAGAALVMAALAAEGYSMVDDIKYIERGYDSIVEKLRAMGADIERVDN